MNVSQGIKNIQIHATTRYPIVSAYEFEFLKTESQVKELLKPCTIYFIMQRPVLYINNFVAKHGKISFEINDDTDSAPLICSFYPSDNGFCRSDEELLIDAQFYKKQPDLSQPFNEMAAFKIHAIDQEFLGWFSPQKFIYEFLCGGLKAKVDGCIEDYLDYTVHYIGKAFSQDIWERLTGHHKMQKILTLEDSLNTKALKAPFEISLLMLDIDGFDESNIFPLFDFAIPDGVDPVIHTFDFNDDNESFENYYLPKLESKSEELTTETEAFLVSLFKPSYNDTLFKNYPNIKNGTRDAGYTSSTVLIENLPAILITDTHTQNVILPKYA
ncbi:TPA: hypothetical protein RQL07_004382 [Vibrio vulnificus]|nr:hypothetical protein [Vibrio vulnificus]HDY7434005.1 hypothetical protein [Vibrio vulnificus]HDY7572054.1 hypothetical protein [Vibrio vulnificus]HDY8091077.1 hypothetical protein [Vibrio vulnificus]HDY8113737.1 hypothetical protein [Vibrio vulnificus]